MQICTDGKGDDKGGKEFSLCVSGGAPALQEEAERVHT